MSETVYCVTAGRWHEGSRVVAICRTRVGAVINAGEYMSASKGDIGTPWAATSDEDLARYKQSNIIGEWVRGSEWVIVRTHQLID